MSQKIGLPTGPSATKSPGWTPKLTPTGKLSKLQGVDFIYLFKVYMDIPSLSATCPRESFLFIRQRPNFYLVF